MELIIGGNDMYLGSLEERRARRNEIKLLTAALYEEKLRTKKSCEY